MHQVPIIDEAVLAAVLAHRADGDAVLQCLAVGTSGRFFVWLGSCRGRRPAGAGLPRKTRNGPHVWKKYEESTNEQQT